MTKNHWGLLLGTDLFFTAGQSDKDFEAAAFDLAVPWHVGGDSWDFTRPGKRLQKAMEHHHFLMGKSTISMAIFNSKLLNYQRVS